MRTSERFHSVNNFTVLAKSGQSTTSIVLRAIVKCCVLRGSSSGGFLQDSVLEGTSFDDECDLFVAA